MKTIFKVLALLVAFAFVGCVAHSGGGSTAVVTSNKPITITYEASIKSNLFSDTYLTMSNISDSDIFNVKFQKKPFMNFIWFSVILISFGGILNFFSRKKIYKGSAD